MLKWISPLFSRLHMAPRPRLFSVTGHAGADPDQPTAGQRLAERVAAWVGSWWFLGGQATFLVLWLIYNTLQFTRHFDAPPYILLNLLLSFQAAFTGPVLLIAANVGALRDHQQADRVEHLSAQNEALAEQNRQLMEQLVGLEQTVDEHVQASIRAHTIEIQQVYALMREVHASVTGKPLAGDMDLSAVEAIAPAAQPVSRARPRSASRERSGDKDTLPREE